MNVTEKDIVKLQAKLDDWKGAEVFFNTYVDDHDRLKIGLQHPERGRVGLAFFYCSYLAGPVRWSGSHLVSCLYEFEDGSVGMEIKDSASGFVVRCHSLSLYGDQGITVPET